MTTIHATDTWTVRALRRPKGQLRVLTFGTEALARDAFGKAKVEKGGYAELKHPTGATERR